jgi:hypothetical protein
MILLAEMFFWAVLYTPEGKRLKESSATFLRQFDRDYYNGYQKIIKYLNTLIK